MTLWEPDTPEALQESVRAFERRLHEFQSELSLSASFCAENLEYYASTPWLTRYIHIHTSWHQANCDIFRFFLAGYKEAIPQSLLNRIDPEFVLYAMEKCLAHAVAMTDVFSSVLQLDRELPPMDNDIAICAYHCTRVILYCLRNNVGRNPLTLEAGLRRASVCLQAVTRIFGMSPAPRIMVSNTNGNKLSLHVSDRSTSGRLWRRCYHVLRIQRLSTTTLLYQTRTTIILHQCRTPHEFDKSSPFIA